MRILAGRQGQLGVSAYPLLRRPFREPMMTGWRKAVLVICVLIFILNVGLGVYNAAQGEEWLGQALAAAALAGAFLLAWFYGTGWR